MASKRKSSGGNIGKKRVAMRNLKGKKQALTDKESRKVKGGLSFQWGVGRGIS